MRPALVAVVDLLEGYGPSSVRIQGCDTSREPKEVAAGTMWTEAYLQVHTALERTSWCGIIRGIYGH